MAGARVTQRHVASQDDIAYHEGQGLLVPLSEVDNPTVGGWGRRGWTRRETNLDLLLYSTVWVMRIGLKTHLGSKGSNLVARLMLMTPVQCHPFLYTTADAGPDGAAGGRPALMDVNQGAKIMNVFSSRPLHHQGTTLPGQLFVCIAFCHCQAFSIAAASARGVQCEEGLGSSVLSESGATNYSSMDAQDDVECKVFLSHCLSRVGKQNSYEYTLDRSCRSCRLQYSQMTPALSHKFVMLQFGPGLLIPQQVLELLGHGRGAAAARLLPAQVPEARAVRARSAQRLERRTGPRPRHRACDHRDDGARQHKIEFGVGPPQRVPGVAGDHAQKLPGSRRQHGCPARAALDGRAGQQHGRLALVLDNLWVVLNTKRVVGQGGLRWERSG